MDWARLEEAVSDAAANGDELAAMVHNLELEKRSVTIALEPPEDEATSFSCLRYTRLTTRVSLFYYMRRLLFLVSTTRVSLHASHA